MAHPFRLIAVGLLLSMTGLACGVSQLTSGLPTSPSSHLLFQDDFSDSSSGWNTLQSEAGAIEYTAEGLRFQVNQMRYDLWSVPSLHLGDVHVEVDAIKSGGPDDNDFGIICRYSDENHFYALLVSSDGYYGISKMENGEHNLLGMDGMRLSDAVNKGTAANHLRADCVGDTLTLYANGVKLYEVKDASYSSGDVGLIAGSFDQPGVEIVFDNFMVAKP